MSYVNKKEKTNETLPAIPDEIRKEFLKVLRVQTHSRNEHSMHYFLTRWLDKRKLVWKYDAAGNILVTKGDADWYPCIVAHMDTVHPIVPGYKIMKTTTGDDHEVLYAKKGKHKTGIGGDDKCGIFAVLYMLEIFDNIQAVFFTQEESGCVGSSNIDLSLLDNAGYIIQLDRWGRGDFICKDTTYDFVSEEFNDILSDLKDEYGYEDAEGLVTDSVKLFRRGIGVSCINLSCGYYQHHTDSEKIDLNQFWNAVTFTQKAIQLLGCDIYPKDNVARPKSYINRSSYDGEDEGTPGYMNGEPGHWKNGLFHPIEEELTEEQVFEKIDEMSDAEIDKFWNSWSAPKYDRYDWMMGRFSNKDFHTETGLSVYTEVDVENIVFILEQLNMRWLVTESDFDRLGNYWRDAIGADYMLYYNAALHDKVENIDLGTETLEEFLGLIH